MAPMVMAFETGGNSGAVNKPAAEIIPIAGLPPAKPFTNQFTATAAPFAWAVKVCVSPPRTVALPGITVSWFNGGGGLPPLLVTMPVQPVRRRAKVPLSAINCRFTSSASGPWPGHIPGVSGDTDASLFRVPWYAIGSGLLCSQRACVGLLQEATAQWSRKGPLAVAQPMPR
jgi:hypothetical protein